MARGVKRGEGVLNYRKGEAGWAWEFEARSIQCLPAVGRCRHEGEGICHVGSRNAAERLADSTRMGATSVCAK